MKELTEEEALKIHQRVIDKRKKNKEAVARSLRISKNDRLDAEIIEEVMNQMRDKLREHLIWIELGELSLFGGSIEALSKTVVDLQLKGTPIQDYKVDDNSMVSIAFLPIDVKMFQDEMK